MKRIVALSVFLLCLVSSAAAQSPPLIVYPPGAYFITTPGPTTITYTATSITLSWSAPAPTPVPPMPVPPAPTPPPLPVLTGHVWALAFYDPTVILSAPQQAALTSLTLRTSSLLQDVDFHAHSIADPATSEWIAHITGKLPVLIFVQKGQSGVGVLDYQTALPGSEADILSLINKVRGK